MHLKYLQAFQMHTSNLDNSLNKPFASLYLKFQIMIQLRKSVNVVMFFYKYDSMSTYFICRPIF